VWRRPIGCLKLQVIFCKESLIIGLFCGKSLVNIRHPVGLRHPVDWIYIYLELSIGKKLCCHDKMNQVWSLYMNATRHIYERITAHLEMRCTRCGTSTGPSLWRCPVTRMDALHTTWHFTEPSLSLCCTQCTTCAECIALEKSIRDNKNRRYTNQSDWGSWTST